MELPTIYKAYFLGLNFREYPHNSYGLKYGTFRYLHLLDPEDLQWLMGDPMHPTFWKFNILTHTNMEWRQAMASKSRKIRLWTFLEPKSLKGASQLVILRISPGSQLSSKAAKAQVAEILGIVLRRCRLVPGNHRKWCDLAGNVSMFHVFSEKNAAWIV